jgi:hypothetical protein
MQRRLVLILIALMAACVLLPVSTGRSSAEAPAAGRIFLPLIMRLPAQTVEITYVPSADAYVSETWPDENRGSVAYLLAGYDEETATLRGTVRSLIWFDLPAWGPGRVTRATLRLYYGGSWDVISYPGLVRVIRVQAAAAAWDEATVTWRNRPEPPLPDLYGSLNILSEDQPGYRDIDVTALVQQWSARSIPNYGLYLIGPEARGSDWSYHLFLSREAAETNYPYPPELVVTLQ